MEEDDFCVWDESKANYNFDGFLKQLWQVKEFTNALTTAWRVLLYFFHPVQYYLITINMLFIVLMSMILVPLMEHDAW